MQSSILDQLWQRYEFTPNPQQAAAILRVDGPLYLPAGPGSGKTRVLLWRTVNLIVCHGVSQDEIYLSTFTEKAARQLREGLRVLLGAATNLTGQQYDISRMYVGTTHALCQQLLKDRRFYPNRQRSKPPVLIDELSQYFHVYRSDNWANFMAQLGLSVDEAPARLNHVFASPSASRHNAATSCLSLFNRLSEECLDPAQMQASCTDLELGMTLQFYANYRASLELIDKPRIVDFSLLQQEALKVLEAFDGSKRVFQHVIIDEYQDTNTVQERIFFHLASGHKNICVVGDDDQALYRFRGATVENFVEFPTRCWQKLGMHPEVIPLATNYRSRRQIVDFYTAFMRGVNWQKQPGEAAAGAYRVLDKDIQAHSNDQGVAVVASRPAKPDDVASEIADLVRSLIDQKRVEDPNQIAFLFPSLKAAAVGRMKHALEAVGLRVYAPRAGRFIEVEESTDMFGLFAHIFGRPARGNYGGDDYREFHDWLDRALARGTQLQDEDPALARYVRDRQQEIALVQADYAALSATLQRRGWTTKTPYDVTQMETALMASAGLSERAKHNLQSQGFKNVVNRRAREGNSFGLGYVLNSATSLDWSVLDLFYRLCGFAHFKQMFDLAENGHDEGPICNLGLISQYLARFTDEYASVITAPLLLEPDNKFSGMFFMSFLFALFRLGESEFENAEDPFPRGRIPFLTVHQSKGLEFPVVVLGNLRKDDKGPQIVERLVHPFVQREGEPLDRMSEFDIMRMFYVALSRAKNLLVLAHYKGQGQRINKVFQQMLDMRFPHIDGFDVGSVPAAKLTEESTPRSYSYTADYQLYQKCPRQYMIFRKYGFVPSRAQTMMFGNLIHRTLDDLHQMLISERLQSAEQSSSRSTIALNTTTPVLTP